MCENIVALFECGKELTDRQVHCLLKQIEEGKNTDGDDYTPGQINYGFGDDIPNLKCVITIKLDGVPSNCDECPLCIEEYDEDAMWGSGYSRSCMLGCSIFGSSIRRPGDCPIEVAAHKT